MTPRPDGVGHLAHVRGTVVRRGQEMEHRAIVPDVVAVVREGERGHVAAKPVDPVGVRAKALAGDGDGGRGNVRHVQPAAAAIAAGASG